MTPDPFLLGLITAASTGLVAIVAKIFSVSTVQGRIEQKLDDHITDERGKFENIDRRFDAVEDRLPNGEFQKVLAKITAMERALAKYHGPHARRRSR